MGQQAGSRAGQLYQQASQQPNQMWGPPAQQQPAYGSAPGMFSGEAAPYRPQRPGMGIDLPRQPVPADAAGLYGQAGRGAQMQGYLNQLQQARGPMGPTGADQTPGVYGQAGRGQQMQGLVSQLQGAMQNPQVQQVMQQYGPQLAALAQQFGGLNLGALNQMPAQAPQAPISAVPPPIVAAAPGGYVNPYGRAAGGTMADRMSAALAAAPQGGGITPEQWAANTPFSQGPAQQPGSSDLGARLAAMYGQRGRIPRM